MPANRGKDRGPGKRKTQRTEGKKGRMRKKRSRATKLERFVRSRASENVSGEDVPFGVRSVFRVGTNEQHEFIPYNSLHPLLPLMYKDTGLWRDLSGSNSSTLHVCLCGSVCACMWLYMCVFGNVHALWRLRCACVAFSAKISLFVFKPLLYVTLRWLKVSFLWIWEGCWHSFVVLRYQCL